MNRVMTQEDLMYVHVDVVLIRAILQQAGTHAGSAYEISPSDEFLRLAKAQGMNYATTIYTFRKMVNESSVLRPELPRRIWDTGREMTRFQQVRL